MTLFARTQLLFALTLSVACWAQEPAASPAVPGAPAEVIRKAIPVDEPMQAVGASLAIESLPRTLPENFRTVYNRCDIPEQVVALTFDDGPHPEHTPKLLDYLRERGIKATFFLVGRNVKAYPQVVRRIAEEGHEVANHSWSHPLLTSLGTEGVESQLRRTHDAIIAACGKVPLLYRPPYGQARLSQRTRIRESFGYASILWDVDPLDWQSPRTAQKVHDRVLAATRSGSIILCHDIHETTVAAMPALLDDLKAKGFQFATVTQLLQLGAKAAPATVTVPATEDPSVAPSPALPPGSTPADMPIPVPDSAPVPDAEAAPQPKL